MIITILVSALVLLIGGFFLLSRQSSAPPGHDVPTSLQAANAHSLHDKPAMNEDKVIKTKQEWAAILTPEQYKITREGGTERPFDNAYHDNKEAGVYNCVSCGQALFSSEHKYDSGTGWPSFYQPINPEAVTEKDDFALFSRRTEILCSRCDAHLGHVFEDGPEPTGLRYCMNSAALKFEPEEPNAR